MGEGQASVARLAASEIKEICIRLLPHPSTSSPSSSSLRVSVPVSWLSRWVPFLATMLNKEPHEHTVTLQCTQGSSPQAYLQGLRILRQSRWLSRLNSVDHVLELLPVADHLLLQGFWSVCMEFLALSPWSVEEEDSIRATITKLNMQPSSDVKERLDTSQDVDTLETMLLDMLSRPSMEASFCDLCQKCLQSSSGQPLEGFNGLLLYMMDSISSKDPMSREWYVLVKFLLQNTDAEQLISDLLSSRSLLPSLASPPKFMKKDAVLVFQLMIRKVLQRGFPLSNSNRAKLVKWSGSGSMEQLVNEDSDLDYMRLQLAETLPFSDPVRMDVMKSKPESMPIWAHQVAHRLGLMDELKDSESSTS